MDQTKNYNTEAVQPLPGADGYRHPSFVKREIGRVYNRTGGALLLNYLIIIVIQLILLACLGYYDMVIDMTMGNDVDESRMALIAIISLAAAYVIGDIGAAAIGLHFSRRLKGSSDMFGKSELGLSAIISAMFLTVGMQVVCIIIQNLYILITGDPGMSGATASMLSFGKGTLTDVCLFIYMVILAPVAEELLFRGMLLKNFSAVSRRFGIIMTSLCFGLFHGNVMQFIAGFILGMLFSYLDIKANSIIPSIILHIFNNLTNALVGIFTIGASDETISFVNGIYTIIALFLGIIGLVLSAKTLRGKKDDTEEKNAPKHEVYEEFLAAETQGMDGLTWKTAAKSPCLWIFAILYILMIISPMLLSALVAKYPAFFGS